MPRAKREKFATLQAARFYCAKHKLIVTEYVQHSRGARLNIVDNSGKKPKVMTLCVENPVVTHRKRVAAEALAVAAQELALSKEAQMEAAYAQAAEARGVVVQGG